MTSNAPSTLGPTSAASFKSVKISYFNDALIMHLVDFPIYYIESISERHVLVAGGGGSAKTGVHNQINILEIVQSGHSCTAALVMKYQTPPEVPDAIMSGALMRDLPIVDTRQFTGGSQLTMYTICYNHQKKTFSVTDYETLEQRLPNSEIKTLKYIPGILLTGSMDGQLAVWDMMNDKKMTAKIRAHEAEIDEIDVDPHMGHIVTVCRSKAKCCIWKLGDSLKKVHEFDKEFINSNANQPVGNSTSKPSKYAFRSCKYGPDCSYTSPKSDDRKSFLYIACNSIPSNGTSKLYKISSQKLTDYSCKTVPIDGIMAMKVSQDGQYIGIGTRLGSVMVLEAKNLNQIYAINGSHLNAVTNLEFLESKPETLSLTNSPTCALLSVSIDRRVVLHRPKKASMTRKILQSISAAFVICFLVSNLFKL